MNTYYTLTIIYIYFNFTILTLLIVQIGHFANASCRQDGLGLVELGYRYKFGPGFEQLTRQLHEK